LGRVFKLLDPLESGINVNEHPVEMYLNIVR